VLNVLGLGLALVLGGSAVILIANTIRMAIYARRDEVSIMKLVGASNWFIRVPFVLEGLIEGILGAGLAVLTVWIASQNLRGIGDSIQLLRFNIEDAFFLRWGILLILFGAAAGVLGSLVGLSKYLREAETKPARHEAFTLIGLLALPGAGLVAPAGAQSSRDLDEVQREIDQLASQINNARAESRRVGEDLGGAQAG
jgi:hypothetical protein